MGTVVPVPGNGSDNQVTISDWLPALRVVPGTEEAREHAGHRSPEPGRASRRHTGQARPRDESGETDRRSEEHTSELQSRENLVCRLLLEKKKTDSRHTSC